MKPMSFSHVSRGKFSGTSELRNSKSASVNSVDDSPVGMSYVHEPDAQSETVVAVHVVVMFEADELSHAWNSRSGQRISPSRMSLPNWQPFSLHVQSSSSVHASSMAACASASVTSNAPSHL